MDYIDYEIDFDNFDPYDDYSDRNERIGNYED
jgi:hypothetical protein